MSQTPGMREPYAGRQRHGAAAAARMEESEAPPAWPPPIRPRRKGPRGPCLVASNSTSAGDPRQDRGGWRVGEAGKPLARYPSPALRDPPMPAMRTHPYPCCQGPISKFLRRGPERPQPLLAVGCRDGHDFDSREARACELSTQVTGRPGGGPGPRARRRPGLSGRGIRRARVRLAADEVAQLAQLVCPRRVWTVALQDILEVASCGSCGRSHGRYGATSADDDEALPSVLDRVEHLGEAACGLGCRDLPHGIMIIRASRLGRLRARVPFPLRLNAMNT